MYKDWTYQSKEQYHREETIWEAVFTLCLLLVVVVLIEAICMLLAV